MVSETRSGKRFRREAAVSRANGTASVSCASKRKKIAVSAEDAPILPSISQASVQDSPEALESVEPTASPPSDTETVAPPAVPEEEEAAPRGQMVMFEIPTLAQNPSLDTGDTTDTDYEYRRRVGEADNVFYRRIGV